MRSHFDTTLYGRSPSPCSAIPGRAVRWFANTEMSKCINSPNARPFLFFGGASEVVADPPRLFVFKLHASVDFDASEYRLTSCSWCLNM